MDSGDLGKLKADLKAELLAEIRAERDGSVVRLPRPGYDGDLPKTGHKLLEVRQFANAAERELMQKRLPAYWPHISPDSTLVAVVGNHYKPGSWQRIADMVTHTNAQGVRCALSELQDRCFHPFDALGTMRNEAILKAQLEGFDWLCMVDADVKPEKDTLLQLLGWQVPIVAPYVVEAGTGRKLHGPVWEPDQGLRPLKWCVLSMVVFRTAVFNCLAGALLWSDAIGADEGFHFQRLAYYGHRPYLDTNTHLVVDERPHYPLATMRFTKAEYDAYWENQRVGRLSAPDRRPVRADEPQVVDGEYNPFTGAKPLPELAPVAPSPTATPSPGASGDGQKAAGALEPAKPT